jgi:hypothetical protein
VVTALAWQLERLALIPKRNAADWVAFFIFAVVMAVSASGPLHWLLRVDGAGIARRRYFVWDLWPWQAFQDGLVQPQNSLFRYRRPAQRWWRRTLSFEFLDDTDKEVLKELVRRMLVPPPESTIPDEFCVEVPRTAFPRNRKLLTITRAGIRLRSRGEERTLAWSDVRLVRIKRLEHDRRDFRQLELALPDQSITLAVSVAHGQESANWSGPAVDVIVRAIEQYVAADRIRVTALHGPPRSVIEADERIAEFDKALRELRYFGRIALSGGGAVLFGLAVSAIPNGWPQAISLSVMFLVQFSLFWVVLRHIEASRRASREELVTWRCELIGELEPTAGQTT